MANSGACRTAFSGAVLIVVMWVAASGCSFVFSSTSGASAQRKITPSEVVGEMGGRPVADRVVVPVLESSVEESSWLARLAVHVSIAAACGLVLGLGSIPAYAQQQQPRKVDGPLEFLRLLRAPPQADTPYIENPEAADEEAKEMIKAATENKRLGQEEARKTEKDRQAVLIDLRRAGGQEIDNMPPSSERSKAADGLSAKMRDELSRISAEKQSALDQVDETWRIERQAAVQMGADAKANIESQRKAKVAWKDEVEKQASEEREQAELQARLDEQNAIKRVADMKRQEAEDILSLPYGQRAAAEQDLRDRSQAIVEEAKSIRIAADQTAKDANREARQRAAGMIEKGPPVFGKIE